MVCRFKQYVSSEMSRILKEWTRVRFSGSLFASLPLQAPQPSIMMQVPQQQPPRAVSSGECQLCLMHQYHPHQTIICAQPPTPNNINNGTGQWLARQMSQMAIQPSSQNPPGAVNSGGTANATFVPQKTSVMSPPQTIQSSNPHDQTSSSSSSSVCLLYSNDTILEEFVAGVAKSLGRDAGKASEWLSLLQSQDLQCVGDLRQLREDDWTALGLTVFAGRAFRNALTTKKPLQSNTGTNTNMTNNNPAGTNPVVTEPPTINSPRPEVQQQI